MYKILEIPIEERVELFKTVAIKLKCTEAIIEKDFWVSWMLEYLFTHFPFRQNIVFKGGTCLSKVHNMIQRFSEDIDLALDWSLLNIDKDQAYAEKSNRQQDIFNKAVNTETEKYIEKEWLPILKNDFKTILKEDFELWIDEGEPQTIIFRYPRFFSDQSILQTIRLEVGVLAEIVPSKLHNIQPMIADVFPSLMKENISVKAIDVHRTFFEKITILHREANRMNENWPKRYSRHFYDVYQMILNGIGDTSLDMIDLLYNVIEFKKKFYPCKWAKYEEIYSGNLKLVCSPEANEIFKKDYALMSSMIYGDIPEFDIIIEHLKIYENRLNCKIALNN